MLTTSRNTVLNDNYAAADSYYGNLGVQSQELPAATSSYFAKQKTENEYSLEDITRKILGDGALPPEYDEVDLSKVGGATPTLRTLSSSDESVVTRSMFYQEATTPRVNAQTLSMKQIKVGVSVFAVLVLALAIVIAFTAVSVTGSFANALALESQYLAQTELAEQLSSQLAVVDEAEIIRLAESAGYMLPGDGNTMTYTVPEMRAAQGFDIQSNWFNNLCDAISSAFGG